MKYVMTILALLLPSLALAHGGHEQALLSVGIAQGFLHPLLGIDHLIALLAVGVLAARLEGKQKWMVPFSFMALMLAGFFAAHAGLHLVSAGTIEMLITVSLVAAAVFVVLGQTMLKFGVFHKVAAWSITGFAAAHGLAHGLEIPVGADAQGFALGFASACLAIMAGSIYMVSAIKKHSSLKLA